MGILCAKDVFVLLSAAVPSFSWPRVGEWSPRGGSGKLAMVRNGKVCLWIYRLEFEFQLGVSSYFVSACS